MTCLLSVRRVTFRLPLLGECSAHTASYPCLFFFFPLFFDHFSFFSFFSCFPFYFFFLLYSLGFFSSFLSFFFPSFSFLHLDDSIRMLCLVYKVICNTLVLLTSGSVELQH